MRKEERKMGGWCVYSGFLEEMADFRAGAGK